MDISIGDTSSRDELTANLQSNGEKKPSQVAFYRESQATHVNILETSMNNIHSGSPLSNSLLLEVVNFVCDLQ